MKKTLATIILAFALTTSLFLQSCGNNERDTTNSENTISTTPETSHGTTVPMNDSTGGAMHDTSGRMNTPQ